MSSREPRTLGYYAASHWFQVAVVSLMLGALALVLLRALDEVEQQAERQMVELTLRNMRTGIRLAMSEALMRQRERDIAAWAGSDPTRWLEAPPTTYRGECSSEEKRNLPPGAWCYEPDSQQLVYRPRNMKYLRSLGDRLPCRELAWRVVPGADAGESEAFFGMRIEAGSSCRWLVHEN